MYASMVIAYVEQHVCIDVHSTRHHAEILFLFLVHVKSRNAISHFLTVAQHDGYTLGIIAQQLCELTRGC